MKSFASKTTCSVEKSKVELDTLLGKAGATSRGIMADDQGGQAALLFRLEGASYRLCVPLPKLGDFPAKGDAPRRWHEWSDAQQAKWRYERWEQGCRTRWRVLILLVKSKLEIIRLGASTAQREFMADLVLANGKTVHEVIADGVGSRLLPAAQERP